MNTDQYNEMYKRFRSLGDSRNWSHDTWPILDQDKSQKADYSFEYLAHCGWAARILAQTKTQCHVDFGSHTYFAGIASAITQEFVYCDIRPIDMPLPGLHCQSADLMNLDSWSNNTQPSVSCLHVMEHIGLGRYGDQINPSGDLIAARELSRIVRYGGQLLIVEPVNLTPRLSFNAHRIYSYNQVLDMFPDFRLRQFTLIKDRSIIYDADPYAIVDSDTETNDTGCFWFIKK